jgi:putative NADPH-quinone reductase
MKKRILIIDGHPDSNQARYVHALAHAYQQGAESAGHEVRTIAVGALEFPLLRTSEEFQSQAPPDVIRECQQNLAWANHWLILYPLWLGSMPAALKGFFEQTLRPGFAFAAAAKGGLPRKLLRGRSARIVVTMGMPAFFYRWYFRAHSLKSLERNVLAFCGIAPVHASIVGMVEDLGDARRTGWLKRMQELGRAAR